MWEYSVLPVGIASTNCYFVYNRESRTLYIIDPGANAEGIAKRASEYEYRHLTVLLTHAHVDHISALGEIKTRLKIDNIYCNQPDHFIYESKNNHLLPFLPSAKNLPPLDDINDFSDFEIIETPGHTPGGVCFYFKRIPVLFSGDTLFTASVGRTDLPGGDSHALIDSIRNKLMILDDSLKVCPGHGGATTIGEEKKNNPFL